MPFPDYGPERDDYIIRCVQEGRYTVNWAEVVSTVGRHVARFYVFADALRIEGVRVTVTAAMQQRIADLLGCVLLTPKLADLVHTQAEAVVEPFPRFSDDPAAPSSTEWMVEHSLKIDQALDALGCPPASLVSTVGKHWCLDDMLVRKPEGLAVCYGWHFRGKFHGLTGELTMSLARDPTGQFVRVLQGRDIRGMHETDYAQTCVLAHEACVVDNTWTSLSTLLQDPDLASLASHQGRLKIIRQPGVPYEAINEALRLTGPPPSRE